MSAEQQRLYVIDLDFTLLDTNEIYDALFSLCQDRGLIAADIIRAARAAVEASGGSFDPATYLLDEGATEQDLLQISADLAANEAERDYLYPDAVNLLEALDATETPSLILTWGSIRNQMTKLRATGLDNRNYAISSVKSKGELISRSRGPEGDYRLASSAGKILAANSGVLVDDKAISFEGLPEDWSGYLIRRGEPRPSQLGDIPQSVVVVPNLDSVTSTLGQAASI